MEIIKKEKYKYAVLEMVENKVEVLGDIIFTNEDVWVFLPNFEIGYELNDLNKIVKHLKKLSK